MDKTEEFLKNEMGNDQGMTPLDVDAIIAGTHARIKRRASRRKAIYTSPLAVLAIVLGIMLFPDQEGSGTLPGGELFMAGWEYSWTETNNLDLGETEAGLLFEETIDYLINENYFTYSEDTEVLLDENDLAALKGYLEEA